MHVCNNVQVFKFDSYRLIDIAVWIWSFWTNYSISGFKRLCHWMQQILLSDLKTARFARNGIHWLGQLLMTLTLRIILHKTSDASLVSKWSEYFYLFGLGVISANALDSSVSHVLAVVSWVAYGTRFVYNIHWILEIWNLEWISSLHSFLFS